MNANCLKNCKVHLIQPMGGGGTRFLGSQIMPKPLIEIQCKPFMYWSAISLDSNLVNDITFVVLKEHIEKFGIDKVIKKYFKDSNIVVLDHILNGAVLTCIEGVKAISDDLPIIFNDCDHCFKSDEFKEFLQNIDESVDGGFLSFKSNEDKYSYIKYDKDGKISGTVEKQVVSDDAICGTYYFKNKEIFIKYAESYLQNCNYNEFFMSGVYNEMCKDGLKIKKFETDIHLSFGTPDEYLSVKDSQQFSAIEALFKKSKIKNSLSKYLSDVEVVKDFSSGSDAFTFLVKKDGKLAYRKIAVQEFGGVDKLASQLDFIKQYKDEMHLTEVSGEFISEKCCYYEMPASDSCQRFIDFIDKNSISSSVKILDKILKNINNFHKNHILDFDAESLKQYLNEKVYKNAETIIGSGGGYLTSLSSYDDVEINGRLYKNLSFYFNNTDLLKFENLYNLFSQDVCSIIHGDLTVDNVICDAENDQGYYLIDSNIGNIYQSSLLDYAKMNQSLHGKYELLKFAKLKSIDGNKIVIDFYDSKNYNKLYDEYLKLLNQMFDKSQIKSIYFHEIIHWLRLMPYKIRKDEKTAVIYFSKLLMLLDELNRQYGE